MSADLTAEGAAPPQATAATTLSATRPFYWSVRREIWENGSLYIAPMIVGGLTLVGFLLGAVLNFQGSMRFSAGSVVARRALSQAVPYSFAAFAIMATALIVGFFYCLAALHTERKDRSILFWKSLPVSDTTTVLSKAAIPLVVLPVIAFACVIATQLVMLVLHMIILAVGGHDLSSLWATVRLPQMTGLLAYGLIVHSLWYAPIIGWLLLVSAWAKQTPILWAVLPPLAIGIVEKIATDTGYVLHLLQYRLAGGMDDAFSAVPHVDGAAMELPRMDPARFFSSPGLWIGLVVAAVFIATAIWLRRRREPI
jgi:ABC-2 type transport system permease protein